MKLKLVVVDLELSRRQRLLGAAGLGAAILMVGAVAVADVPNTFVAGDTLTAAGLNANFDDIDARIAEHDTRLIANEAAVTDLSADGAVFSVDVADGTLGAVDIAPGALNHGHALRVVPGNLASQTVTTFPGATNACSACPAGSTVASVSCLTSNSSVTAISFYDTANNGNNSGCCGFIVQAGGGNITVSVEARCLILDPVALP